MAQTTARRVFWQVQIAKNYYVNVMATTGRGAVMVAKRKYSKCIGKSMSIGRVVPVGE